MRLSSESRSLRLRTLHALLGALAVGAAATACGDVDVHTPDVLLPSGIITGAVVYNGPPPCVQSVFSSDDGSYHVHVVGAAVLLVFNEKLLPPPEGLGTSARSLAVVAGDELFDSVQGQLPTPPDGGIACPAANAPPVSVSAAWAVGPLEAGRFQIRGFYDYDGDFSPVLKIHQLPTAGDVGGGALENPVQAAQGTQKPHYQTISIGNDDGQGGLVIPDEGARVDGVTVNLGLVLPNARPISYVESVLDERPNVDPSLRQSDPTDIRMVVDQTLSLSPTNPAHASVADKEFLRLVFHAGVPDGERAAAVASPISLQAVAPYDHFHVYPSTDDAGSVIDIPETPAGGAAPIKIPDLFPQAIFGKLDGTDPSRLTNQASPAVLINGLVTTGALTGIVGFKQPKDVDTITVNIRPSAICLDPLDAKGDIVLVTPSFTAVNGSGTAPDTVIGDTDIANLKAYLGAKFSRSTDQVKVIEGCLPPGVYSANLVYDTGQAWTLPNEAGECQTPLETPIGPASSPTGCHYEGSSIDRPVLTSQRAMLTVQGASNPGFCENVAGTNHGDAVGADAYLHGVPRACLTPAELAAPATLQALVSQ